MVEVLIIVRIVRDKKKDRNKNDIKYKRYEKNNS